MSPDSHSISTFTERFIQTVRNECLDHFVLFGERHLGHVLREYEDFCNTLRPHQGIGNRQIGAGLPSGADPPNSAEVECSTRLGGLLRHYHRRAA